MGPRRRRLAFTPGRLAGGQEGAAHIDGEHLVELGDGGVQRQSRQAYPGVGVGGVQRAEGGLRRRDPGHDRGLVGDVHGHGEGVPAFGPDGVDHGGEAVGAAGGDGDPGPLARGDPGQVFADAG